MNPTWSALSSASARPAPPKRAAATATEKAKRPMIGRRLEDSPASIPCTVQWSAPRRETSTRVIMRLVRVGGFWISSWLLSACSPAENVDRCPKGICVGLIDGGGAGDLAGADLTGVCVEAWSCTAWAPNGKGMYTRVCFDGNKCGTTVDKP